MQRNIEKHNLYNEMRNIFSLSKVEETGLFDRKTSYIAMSNLYLSNPKQLETMCNYSDLQPLWVKYNLVKSTKLVSLSTQSMNYNGSNSK